MNRLLVEDRKILLLWRENEKGSSYRAVSHAEVAAADNQQPGACLKRVTFPLDSVRCYARYLARRPLVETNVI